MSAKPRSVNRHRLVAASRGLQRQLLHLLHRSNIISWGDTSERDTWWKGGLHGEEAGIAGHHRLLGIHDEAMAEQRWARPGIRSWLQVFQSTSSMVLSLRKWSSTASTSGLMDSSDTVWRSR